MLTGDRYINDLKFPFAYPGLKFSKIIMSLTLSKIKEKVSLKLPTQISKHQVPY